MNYLGLKKDDLVQQGGLDTAREICQQPALWGKIWQSLISQRTELTLFLTKSKLVDRVILTGAGTSAFIGESLVGCFFQNFHPHTQAIPTTHLVSHPYDYISKDQNILLISFARSGNSPESKAAVELVDDISKKCYHLIITCNETGDLALHQSKNEKYTFLLPSEANDKSLAMTSSYTGMLLTGLLIARFNEIDSLKMQVDLASQYAENILTEYIPLLKDVASLPFKRAVFLGSGPLYGTANESHLKLQELTDGRVICKFDSFLGFRHGPKAVVDNETLIVYLLSNSNHVSKYENDLIIAMEKGKKALTQIAVSEHFEFAILADHHITYAQNGVKLLEDFLTLPAVLPGQILGFFKSLNEGLSPDKPSASGAISRVVEGVNIYSLSKPQKA